MRLEERIEFVWWYALARVLNGDVELVATVDIMYVDGFYFFIPEWTSVQQGIKLKSLNSFYLAL